jgi:ribosomal-protein-serine acetyltransferase
LLRWPIRDDIYLRLPEESDADELLEAIERNRSRLEDWLHWAHATHTREDVLSFVQTARRDFQKPDALHLLIFEKDQIIGSCGMLLDELSKVGEIGYWIDAQNVGRGIITDCCRALIDYGFGHLHLNRFQIRCACGNTRSSAIPKRLGFLHEGTRRQALRTNDRLDDEECYGLLRSEWVAKAAVS